MRILLLLGCLYGNWLVAAPNGPSYEGPVVRLKNKQIVVGQAGAYFVSDSPADTEVFYKREKKTLNFVEVGDYVEVWETKGVARKIVIVEKGRQSYAKDGHDGHCSY